MLPRMILVMSAGVALAVNARAQDRAPEKEVQRLRIPSSVTPKGKEPLFMLRAEGVQIYHAVEKDGKPAWVLHAPRAVLFDYRTGAKIGTHSKGPKGPIWQDSSGSKLTGKLLESSHAPNPDAIPWLLLEATSEGGGRFAKVTHIQRVDTWAGKAPAAPPANLGETREIRYQATYVFWGDR
jgi:hypothetical protein